MVPEALRRKVDEYLRVQQLGSQYGPCRQRLHMLCRALVAAVFWIVGGRRADNASRGFGPRMLVLLLRRLLLLLLLVVVVFLLLLLLLLLATFCTLYWSHNQLRSIGPGQHECRRALRLPPTRVACFPHCVCRNSEPRSAEPGPRKHCTAPLL